MLCSRNGVFVLNNLRVIYIPWSRAIRMCYKLAELVLESGLEFDALVTISRGGLIPGRVVSDVLNIDEFYTIRAKLWGVYGKLYDKPMVKIYEQIDVLNKRVLVIDEVVDSGLTMINIVNILNQYGAKLVKTGVLHYKLTSIHKPDYYVEEIKEWVWIFYPWSLSETLYGLMIKSSDLSIDSMNNLIEKLGVESNYIEYKYLVKSIEKYRQGRLN